jgi:hypothetical protein
MPNNFCGTPKCFRGAKTKIQTVKKNPGWVENVFVHKIYFRGQIKMFPHTNKNVSAYKKKIPRKKKKTVGKYLRSRNTYFPTWPSIII